MKRKIVILILAAAVASLTACGEVDNTQESVPVISEQESESAAESAPESQEYVPEQTIIEYRNQLELEQLMQYSTERQEELSSIMVDLDEEDGNVRSMAVSAMQMLKEGNTTGVLQIVEKEDWNDCMFPSMVIGQRNYYLKLSEQENVRYMIAADEVGNTCTAILYSGENGRFTYLEKSNEQIKIVEYHQAEGTFVSENLRLADGSYVKYEGNLDAENYVLTGDIRIQLGTASMEGAVSQAWSTREQELTEYQGTFNETGRTVIVTPNSLKNEGRLAYATHSQRRGADYLTTETELSADDFSFFGDFAGLYTVWGRLQ